MHGGDRREIVFHAENTVRVRSEGTNQYSRGVLADLEGHSKALERRNVVEIPAHNPRLAMLVGYQRWGEILVQEHPR